MQLNSLSWNRLTTSYYPDTYFVKFSDRIGATQPTPVLHLDSMPKELHISLWNLLVVLYDDVGHRSYWKRVTTGIAKDILKHPIDDLPYHESDIRKWLKVEFMGMLWHEVYNALEYIVQNHVSATSYRDHGYLRVHPVGSDKLVGMTNRILEEERSGYRFIGEVLAPISSHPEIDEVASAASLGGAALYGAGQHISTALELFSKRPDPDYRNAVKEAISAIESIAKQLGRSDGDGLAHALRALTEKAGLHGSLKVAFEKMYGYTSSESGIRHAILEEPTVGFEEAKYMIVACSAFANYLVGKSHKAGLLQERK